MRKVKIGFSLVELLVVVVALGICVVILLSIIQNQIDNKRKLHSYRSTKCMTNLRQLSIITTMYAHDYNEMPGIYDKVNKKYVGWVNELIPYTQKYTQIGAGEDIYYDMFYCKESKSELDMPVCYGYNAALLQLDGTGINEKLILKPNRVGVLCDVAPMKGEGGLIGDTTNLGSKAIQLNVKPVKRHENGVIIGYVDGHASLVVEKYFEHPANEIGHAFYQSRSLGYIKKAGTKGR